MNKGYVNINKYKNVEETNQNVGSDKSNHKFCFSIASNREKHITIGEFTRDSKRFDGGGHTEENIKFLKENKIPYEINLIYNNGVRVGNILNAKNSIYSKGNNHSWFPSDWDMNTINDAIKYLTKDIKATPVERSSITGQYKGVKVTIVFGKNGSISTIYPNKDQPGGIKDDK
jgi:hypothetical protein